MRTISHAGIDELIVDTAQPGGDPAAGYELLRNAAPA